MSDMIQVGIVGRDGRLGREAAAWIHEASDLELSAAVGRDDDWLALRSCDVVLEVTEAGLGAPHGMRLIEMGLRPVIGTSGVDSKQTQELDTSARAAGVGGVVIPNFSVGMLAMQRALSAAGEHFSERAITEAHRAGKVDAPSGTAKALCRLLELPDEQVVSIRLDGLTAAHEVRLRSSCDELVLRHESLGPESFKAGVLASIRFAATAEGISSGLEVVLAEACKVRTLP
jgi:4-hydroxy-tetrahydrodipicolinate reductase